MSTPAKTARITLLKEMLTKLAETEKKLEQLKSEIEKISSGYFQEVLKEKGAEIRCETDNYRNNVRRLADIKLEITSSVNLWYEFRKNSKEKARLAFPLTFAFKKRRLQKNLNQLNEEVSSIIIANRMIKEKLTLFQHQLEIVAMEKIRTSAEYKLYDQLLSKKESIISELEYLLPTIPGLCPASIGSSGIAELLKKLAAFEAA